MPQATSQLPTPRAPFGLRSLRTKLMIGFLGIGLGPLMLLGWLAYDRSRDALLAKASEALQLHATGAVDKMDRNLFERYGDVQAFAANPQARRAPAEVTQAANFYTKLYVIYDLMRIADADGKIIAANTVDADG